MNRKLFSLILLLTWIVFAGCARSTSMPPTETIPAVESIQVASLTPSPTATPTMSKTPIVFQQMRESCIQVDIDNKSGVTSQGVAVFESLSPELVKTIYLQDLEEHTTKIAGDPNSLVNLWGVSPDHKYLLYEYEKPSGDDTDYRLVLANYNGQPIKEFDSQFPSDSHIASYYNWHNNENIRVVLFSESKEAFRMSPRLYNPFTGDYIKMRTDFSGYVAKDIDWGLDWFALSTLHKEGANLIYDQTLSRVLYPKASEAISLIDVETNKELASLRLPNWGRLPKWSPDGNSLVILGTANANASRRSDEFYFVSRDGGEFKRLTYLSNTLEQSAIANYAWSPDSKRIAFWLYSDPGKPSSEGTQSELAILDVETGLVTNLCIQGISAVTHLEGPVQFASLEPIWSPDGNQIMISQWDLSKGENNKKYNVLMVDLPSLTAIKINSNVQPQGWMEK